MRSIKILRSAVLATSVLSSTVVWAANDALRVGLSKKDITFLSAGRGMMGYGDLAQKTQGIESSLFARAAVIEANHDERIAFVVVDLCFVVSLLKNRVLQTLQVNEPGRWSFANIMISATHTHSTPGGIAQHDIYNVTSQGFDERNFENIAQGIASSIADASKRLVPARMVFSAGELRGASINRSTEPYRANHDAHLYADETDPTHTVLGFVSPSGKPLGLLDFFAVHTTSMSKKNRLISGDNKGHAARKVEKYFGGDFVAAFSNANEGDASPNIFKGSSEEKTLSDVAKTERVAEKQFQHALALWKSAKVVEVSHVEGRHRWVDMTDKGCEPAIGESFAAGADDGPSGIPGFFEGMRQGESRPLPQFGAPLVRLVRAFVGSTSGDPRCQYPKPILFAGDVRHPRILPRTLPFQILRIGPVLLVGPPAELTTMSGRRVRAAVARAAAPAGIEHVVLSGLSNDYSGYVTTPEEYAFQHYEGAHTLFGPRTLEIHVDTLTSLAAELGTKGVDNSMAPSFFRPLRSFLGSSETDGKAVWEKVGSFVQQPPTEVLLGDQVSVAVRSGLPTRFKSQADMYRLEQWQNHEWVLVELPKGASIDWRRENKALCRNCSRLGLRFGTQGLEKGEYRLIQRGQWQARFGSSKPYESISRSFKVQ